jgi:hypothetical protein
MRRTVLSGTSASIQVAGLVGPQTGQRVGDRRRFETDRRDVDEVHLVAHVALLVELPGTGSP